MKLPLLTILLFILSFSAFAQDDAIKAVVLNRIVEIAPLAQEDNADFSIIEIKMDGKIVKKFPAEWVGYAEIIGTFKGFDEDYILYRSGIGNGACAGGSLFVIKFRKDSESNLKDINVSPVLTTCLGEYPVFSVIYNKQANMILAIDDHTMNLEYLNKWIEKKTIIKKKR